MEWLNAFIAPAIVMFGAAILTIGVAKLGRVSPMLVLVAMFWLLLSMTAASALQALGLLVLSVVYASTEMSWRHYAKICLGITAIVFAGTVAVGTAKVSKLRAVRAAYPMTSVAHRLSYETTGEGIRAGSGPSALNWRGREQFEERREIASHQLGAYDRERQLEQLHNRHFEQFIAAEGFGYTRMRPISPRIEPLPPAPPLLQECHRASPDHDRSFSLISTPPPSTSLESLHWDGAVNFLSDLRMGYVQDRDHVVGFEAHAFTSRPELEEPQWTVLQLELVSLLKHETPRVYESEFLPNMELLASSDIPTRELDSFEAEALEKLRTRSDVVIDDSQSGLIRMLGSLRANDSCLRCHSVREGDLLGAFSYRLIPAVTSSKDARELDTLAE